MSRVVYIKNIKQTGYTLILVTVLLFIVSAASIQFFNQSTESVKISGASRDSTQSLLLAEAAMEYLRGKFINDLDTLATVRDTSCGDGNTPPQSLDKCEAGNIQKSIKDEDDTLDSKLFHYMYYISDASAHKGITENIPDILQTVANNEKSRMPPEDLDTHTPSLSGAKILRDPVNPINETDPPGINDLFVGDANHPFLFGVNNDGVLKKVTLPSAKWKNAWYRDDEITAQSLKNNMKAAAWFELIQNPDDPTSVDIFVQAAAQVGYAKSYSQRYVASFFNNQRLGEIALLSEAANEPSQQP